MRSKVLMTRVGLGCLLVTGLALATPNAQAGKPAGGGTTTPAYKYINLGTLGQEGWARAVNSSGVVVGILSDPTAAHSSYNGFVVAPKDANDDGKPDVWFEDLNHDGLNDLQIALGRPPGLEDAIDVDVGAVDINDHGQVLIEGDVTDPATGAFSSYLFVLTPRDVNNDGRLEFVAGDLGGPNILMEPLYFDGILDQVFPRSINNLGQIVGEGILPGSFTSMGFVLDGKDTDADGVADTWFADLGSGVNGLVQTLGYARGQYGELTTVTATDINDRGEIAGKVLLEGIRDWGNACLIRSRLTASGQIWCADDNQDGLNDLVVKLLPVDPKVWGAATAISATGKVGGWATLNGGKSDLMLLWQLDPTGTTLTTTKLPMIGGTDWDRPTAINSSGVIVGGTVTYGGGISVLGESAFVFQNGTTKDLRTLTDQTTALKTAWMSANDNNDAGQIVGGTQSSTLGDHPFIAVPVK